jgi:hypothetical protein
LASPFSYPNPNAPSWKVLPAVGSVDGPTARDWVDERIYYTHRLRARDVSAWRRAELYDQGFQWLWRAQAHYDGPGAFSQWVRVFYDQNDPNYIPTPVFNEGLGARANESSRLARPGYKPTVRPRSDAPSLKAKLGAQDAQYLLDHRLREMEWDKEEELIFYHMPLYGGAWIKSEWYYSWDHVTTAPVTTAKACPRHSAVRSMDRTGTVTPTAEGPSGGTLGVSGSTGAATASATSSKSSVTPPQFPGERDKAIDGTTNDNVSPNLPNVGQEGVDVQNPPRTEASKGLSPMTMQDIRPTGSGSDTCDFALSNPAIPGSFAGKHSWLGSNAAPARVNDTTGEVSYMAQACPQCPDHPPLVPMSPTMDEAGSLKDSIGRSMGKQVPLGDWYVTVRSPYDCFPRNLGLDMRPNHVDEIVEVHVETLEWVANRFPDRAADVNPERPEMLNQYHPIAGSPDLYQTILDAKLFKDSIRIKEWHKKPWPERVPMEDGTVAYRMNKGRSLVVAGNTVLLDRDYLIPNVNYPGQDIERCIYEYVPWEFRDGGRRIQGLALWEQLFDPQDATNEIRSQTQNTRQRCAVAFYLVSKQHNFQVSAMRDGVVGRVMEIDVDPDSPNFMPQLMNNETINPGVGAELKDAVDAVQRYAGYVEVEKGETPPNVAAAVAIQSLKTFAGERRGPRIARVKKALERIYSHGLRAMSGLYIEHRKCQYEDESGDERWKMLHGLDLKGQCEVVVEANPEYDVDATNQQVVRDMIQLRVIDPTDRRIKRRIAKHLKSPEDLFEDDDLQDDSAQREYVSFKEEMRVPRVDPSADDHFTHFDTHGRAWHSEYMRSLRYKADWDGALYYLATNWHADLDALLNNSPTLTMTMLRPPQPPPVPSPMDASALGGAIPPPTTPPTPPSISGDLSAVTQGATPPPQTGMISPGGAGASLPPPPPELLAALAGGMGGGAMPPDLSAGMEAAPGLGMQAGAGQPPELANMVPPQPPPAQQPPIDLQTRILEFWVEALALMGWVCPDEESFNIVATWRAHMEAHKLIGQQTQAAAQGAPTMAAPGSPATPAGNMPTAATPPEEAPSPATISPA